MAAAVALVLLCGLGVAVNLAMLDARERYLVQTSPQWINGATEQVPVVRWQPYWAVADGRTVHVVLAQPLVDRAPPPLGLEDWPAPGQFAYSADLRDDVPELENRWGDAVSIIPSTSLPAADSRIIVYRPAFDLAADWDASGYGIPEPGGDLTRTSFGTMTAWRIPPAMTTAGVAILIPVAAVLLVAVVGRISTRHRRTLYTLEAVGVSPAVLHRASFSVVSPSLVAGIAVGVLTAGTLFLVDVPIPLADATSRAIDIRATWPRTWAIVIATAALVTALVWVATRVPTLAEGRRPAVRPPTRWRLLPAGICVVSSVVASQSALDSMRTSMVTNQADLSALWVLGGGLIALLTLPALAAIILTSGAQALRRTATDRGSGVGLLVSRALMTRRLASITAASASIVVVTSIAATWAMGGQVSAVQARQVMDAIDGQFSTVVARTGRTEAAVAGLDGVKSLAVDSTLIPTETGTIDEATIYGAPDLLEDLGLVPGTTLSASELPQRLGLVLSTPDTAVSIASGPAPAWSEPDGNSYRTLILFAADGGRLDEAAVQQQLSRLDSPLTALRVGGEEWIVGANDLTHEVRWVVYIGALAALLFLGTLWVRSYEEHRRRAHHLAPLESLYASAHAVRRVHLWVMLTTSLVGALLGGIVGALFARTASGDLAAAGGAMPIVTTMAVMALVAGLACSLPLAFAVSRDEWTPMGRIRRD